MNYNIDTLVYEGRGCDGGAPFITPRAAVKSVQLFKREDIWRHDGLSLTDTDNNTHRYGNETFPLSGEPMLLKDHLEDNVTLYYITEEKSDKNMNGEKCFAGIYGIFFYTPGKKGAENYDKAIANVKKEGWLVTECVVPKNFTFAGFHGRYGARLDKVGVILERNY